MLRGDAELESQRIRELVIEQGFEGGKTIVDDYVREVRPFFVISGAISGRCTGWGCGAV